MTDHFHDRDYERYVEANLNPSGAEIDVQAELHRIWYGFVPSGAERVMKAMRPMQMQKAREPLADAIITGLFNRMTKAERNRARTYYRQNRREFSLTQATSRRATAMFVLVCMADSDLSR